MKEADTSFLSTPFSVADAYLRRAEEVCTTLKTDAANGLPEKEVGERLSAFGPNTIREKKKQHPFLILLSQFKGPFVILLCVAAGISFWFSEWLDGIAIIIVILFNSVIGFFMEYKAERSMEALKRLTKLKAKVIRDGQVKELSSDLLVPGDVIVAESGDIIPADARIIQCSGLEADESALTGESVSVEKTNSPLTSEVTLAERVNMIYKGTSVTKGNLKAVLTATGMETELGRIASMVQSASDDPSPLEKKIARFSNRIIWVTAALIILIFIGGLLDGRDAVSMLQSSIALAVAAIPEGLPIVTTLALAQGMLRMARHNVIIKKLSAVETLGGTNVICTDKTGTLTKNRIEVNMIVLPGIRAEITQDHSERKTSFISGDKQIGEWSNFALLKRTAVLCNTAEIQVEEQIIREIGDPLETGLLKFVRSWGDDIVTTRTTFLKLDEEPFSSETRIMATLHESGGKYFISAKGAVEELLSRCIHIHENGMLMPMTESIRQQWLTESEQLGSGGLRMIALAYREPEIIPESLSSELVFIGLVGLLDPPREDVHHAISECRSAGIDVVMITGDHPSTAKNIGLKLGLIDDSSHEVIHGKEMPELGVLTPEIKQRWKNSRIFARVTASQKLDLVTVLQESDQVVGMTGDGVNDAPALKKADIGIAMGQRGTQVAQEVADMIIKDDSFSSIVLAIREGRIIFENIRRFIVYLLSCNLSELLIISFTSILNLHYALLPLQILFINLVTDVFPALALGVTRSGRHVMKQPPRPAGEPLIDRSRWISIIVYSAIIAACSLGAVAVTHFNAGRDELLNPQLCNNVLFITLILCQLWHVLNMTSENRTAFLKSDVSRNRYVWYAIALCILLTFVVYFIPPIAKVLSLDSPGLNNMLLMFGFSFLSFVLIRICKRTGLIS